MNQLKPSTPVQTEITSDKILSVQGQMMPCTFLSWNKQTYFTVHPADHKESSLTERQRARELTVQ